MKHISFQFTKRQIRQRSKFVTRRLGWWDLKPGQLLQGVEKGMGLKKGERVKKLRVIRVVSTRPERLNKMTNDRAYGFRECILEGFPTHTPAEFVEMFCESHKGCKPKSIVNRIFFEYLL